MCFTLKTVFFTALLALCKARKLGCFCAKNGDVNILEQPIETSPIIATIKHKLCHKGEFLTSNSSDWVRAKFGNKTGFVYGNDVILRHCDNLTADTVQGSLPREPNTRQIKRSNNHRAASIGNIAICGRNLQLWAQQSPNRILAQREKRCYGIQIGLRQTYQEAFTYCQSSVSYLVDILDDQEQAFIEMLVNRYLSGERVWIGLHDVQNERFFDWTSGKPISYVNWFSVNQAYSSNNHDEQDCVALVPFRGGKWEVESCYTGNPAIEPKHAFICEFEIKSPAQINAVG